MSIPWRNRISLLLIPSILSIFFFLSYRTHAETPGAVFMQPLSPTSAGDAGPSPKILLVTAFFPLVKSKHSMPKYEWWLYQFLQGITTDIYFYTPEEMEPLVRRCRGDLPITVDTTYSSPFDIPPLNETRDRYYEMHAKDRERARHSPELYAVWNAKPFFLDEAVQTLSRAGQEYDYAFWNDAGSFRSTHKYTSWPNPDRVREVWAEGSALSGEKPEDLLFFPLTGVPYTSSKYWAENQGPVDAEVSEGSFFGGSPRTVAWWRRTYYAYHDYYLGLGLFVGKDQTLINALFLLFPSRIIAVWLGDPLAPAHAGLLPLFDQGALGNCGAEWHYYQFWLAAASERQAMREIWESNMRWEWSWWRRRQQCRETRAISMKALLQRQFGRGWEPPRHTITVG
ncbi:hypothetical protein FB451DRAFT_1349901 [Mycena latifolia]|nr:hypothetical protein FB451DRAFT_1349901 [Mycena latifolia]